MSGDAFAACRRLRSARVRREVYVGPWLPEPLVIEPETPETRVIEAELLSLALLAALERLNPVERDSRGFTWNG